MTHLHRFDSEAQGAGRTLFLAELHISQLGHFSGGVLFVRRCIRIDGDHLERREVTLNRPACRTDGTWQMRRGSRGHTREAYLEVEVFAGECILHFGFEESARAHLDVHDVRVAERMQQILQFDVLLAVVFDFAQEPGHDVPQMWLRGQRFVDGAFGAAAALLPDGAGSGA